MLCFGKMHAKVWWGLQVYWLYDKVSLYRCFCVFRRKYCKIVLLFLKFEQRKSLRTEKRSESEKDVKNTNRCKMDFMLNREYLKIINSNWWTKFRLKLIILLECEFGVLKVFVNYEINRICSIIFECFIVKSV